MEKNQQGNKISQPSSPNLKKAALEVKKILEKYDAAGLCIIYEPGFSEYIVAISPSWSVVGVNEKSQLTITPPIEDPANPKAAMAKIADTVNMLANVRVGCTRLMMILSQAEQTVRQRFGIKPPPPPILKPGQNGNRFLP